LDKIRAIGRFLVNWKIQICPDSRWKLDIGKSVSPTRILVQDPVFVSRTKEHALAGVFAMAIVWPILSIIIVRGGIGIVV
jgi:hypothetical protein